uniref:Methyltransferase type 11 domain-containing protein n=1 Tax=Strigamia maritima TaxID=126957 RepID=T1JA07_STRMM
YGNYQSLEIILTKYIKLADELLVTGCGNSRLSNDLYDVGIMNITNIDISETVINVMEKQNMKIRPKMKWRAMDVTNMNFKNEKFNVILDKGTLDAIMPDDSDKVRETVEKMFDEIARITKFGGRYVCITLLQSHILNMLLDWFGKESDWVIRIHVCQNSKEMQNIFPVFAVVCTKLKKIPNIPSILEFGLGEQLARVQNKSELVENVENIQQFMFVRHEILSGKKENAENASFELFAPGSKTWRFSLYLVISSKTKRSVPFAIFIVPQGRELEWLYGTSKGRIYLAENTKCGALVVVHLSRDHVYENLKVVQEELASYVMELAPFGLPKNYQIPFWSAGDDLGKRVICHEGSSEMSGKYVVEDVEVETETFRKLIFLSNQNVVQSEAKLKQKKTAKKYINFNYLACDHHISMVQGLALLPYDVMIRSSRVLLIGLGGGGLAMYLRRNFPAVCLDVVDIDRTVVEVAEKWFNFTPDEKLKVFIDDGINYLNSASESDSSFDVIFLDVDGKDSTVGMSCPPQSFVLEDNLRCMKKVLNAQGLLILNLVCRDDALKETILTTLRKHFAAVYFTHIENEVNNVVYCLPEKVDELSFWSKLRENLCKLLKKLPKEASDQWDIEEYLTNLVRS